MKKICYFILFASFSSSLFAIDTGLAFEDSKLQDRYEKLISEVRCLVCQNQSIKSSNVFLAVDLRNEIQIMISNGKTNNEIGDYLVERYGEFILYRPRYTGYSLLLWIAPLALMLGGLFVVMRVIKSKSN
jgi:cytochrome c-type biogenesis protein CcmH|tara:strand:- start:402 stop:791 length:390 start_codon:yes stop_codon:yes gene_type:complete